jgi:hypothetical protein
MSTLPAESRIAEECAGYVIGWVNFRPTPCQVHVWITSTCTDETLLAKVLASHRHGLTLSSPQP